MTDFQNSLRACPCFSPWSPLASLDHQGKPTLVSITTLGTIALSQNWCPSPPWRQALSYLISLCFFAVRVSGSIVPPTVVLFMLVVAMHKSPSNVLDSIQWPQQGSPNLDVRTYCPEHSETVYVRVFGSTPTSVVSKSTKQREHSQKFDCFIVGLE
jgi:hypothetical protein